MRAEVKKVVLAYSGGLDTSVILTWLKEKYDAEVIAFCADVGQEENLEEVAEKAQKTGATSYETPDLREAFVRDYCFPMLRANAVYEGEYLLGTSIARPIIAKAMMEIAKRHNADAIAHGATGKGNDQVRFELTALAIDPSIRIIAPWREWDLRSRADCIAYAEAHKIPVPVTPEKPFSVDRNLFHLSYEGGVLEDPWVAPPESMFLWTKGHETCSDSAQELVIRYEQGNPVAVDGRRMAPAELLAHLNQVAGEHGVGRVDIVENRFVGMKSRGVYETPGGTVLHKAHRAVESITLDGEAMRLRDSLIPKYASLIYRGFWFSPEREALQALIDQLQAHVTGEARLRLYKGSVTVTGRRSERSLYDEELATFEADDVYDQRDATGFIRLNALRLRVASTVAQRDLDTR